MALRGLPRCSGLLIRLCNTYEAKEVVPYYRWHGGVGASHPLLSSTQAWAKPWCSIPSAEHLGKARLPLSDQQSSVATYEVQVITGNVRGAGSSAPALISLIGEHGQTEGCAIGNENEDAGFERGSKRRYTLQVNKQLGELRRVFVQQVDTADPGDGWFLDQVIVRSPEGMIWHCPCNAWVGKLDGDGLACCTERNLIPIELHHLEDVPKGFNESKRLDIVFGAISIPHPEKVYAGSNKAVNRRNEGWGGEDAYFCTFGRPGVFAMGVADGVYMWKAKGIDSGLFSKTLMITARHLVVSGIDDVVKLMQKMQKRVDVESIQGSSTACLVIVDANQGRLSSANLGDSGFLLLGRSQGSQGALMIKYHSPQQEHQFGYPYQLGHYEGADSPDSAMLMTLAVSSGDVIVVGSDGLWDNLSVSDICNVVGNLVQQGARSSAIARHLAACAFEAAMDKAAVTPYSQGATEAFDMVYSGGKADDITIVVTQLK